MTSFTANARCTSCARVVALLLLLVAGLARSDALDGTLEVRSAYINVNNGVYELYARIIYPANDAIAAALRDGLTLSFDLDVLVSRERRYWLNSDVVALTLRRELQFHTVSERYLVRDLPAGEPQSYATLDEALDALGKVEAWPIIIRSQLADDARYRISLRAGVRRGRLADALRAILFWSNDWHRESEWYSWALPQ
ncbi:MAG: DUF4390 domain-containing protein [Pseudomonadales bacterium]|nr:DUF4390 domain-containing protein [Pseudomonadales bacterium]